MLKYTNYTLKKIEAIFEEVGYQVRYEKGNFQSGYCVVKHQKIVIVNKFFDTEAKINCLIDILDEVEPDEQLLTKKTLKFFVEMLPHYQQQKNQKKTQS